MALFETLSAMLTGKAAAAAATLTIVSGTAAGASGALPDGLQTAFDNVTGVAQENDESVEEVDSLEADTVADDTTGDVDDGATEEVVDTDETDEVEEIEEVDERSEKAEQVLSDLGDGCMPEDEDCDFGQAVAENAREKGEEHAAEGKARAEENKARRGAPDETGSADQASTTDEAGATEAAIPTEDPTAPEETEVAEDAPDQPTEAGEAQASGGASSDAPGAGNKPAHAGR